MRNLIILWLCLLSPYKGVELIETPTTNDTTQLRGKLEDTSPRVANINTKHSNNFSNINSGYDTSKTKKYNGEFIYTISEYDKTDKTLGYNFSTSFRLDTDNEKYSTDFSRKTLFSESVFGRHESDLVNTTSTLELISTTNNTKHNNHLTVYDFPKYVELNNDSKLELGFGDSQEEEDENKESEGQAGEEEEGEEGNGDDYDNYYDNSCDRVCITWNIIWCVIGFVGIVSNVCLCLVFVLHKEMRTSANLMVINLAVSDILCIIFNIIIYIIYNLSSTWQAGEFLCQFYLWARHLLIGSSVYSVVVISLQRFFVLTISFKSNVFDCLLIGKYKNFFVLLLVWMLSGALALRYALNAFLDIHCYGYYEDDDMFLKINYMVNWIVYCVIPVIIIGFSTTATSIRLKKTAKNMPGQQCVTDITRKRVVSSNVLLALIIVFALSYVPFYSYEVYVIWNELNFEDNIDNAVYGLLFINSCFNPVALFIMSRKYRRILINDIICRKNCAFRFINTSENSTITVETRL